MLKLPRFSSFTWLIFVTVAMAAMWPARGATALWLERATGAGVALLFFAHGAELPREAVLSGIRHWRLHLFILAITFCIFPLLMLGLAPVGKLWLPEDLLLGFLFLGALPSAVSSSIAFTAIARGNVPAAVCSAAGSNVFGMLLTPILLRLMLGTSDAGAFSLTDALRDVGLAMLLPFALGQAIRPWVSDWLDRNTGVGERIDQAVLLLIIYVAFAQSVSEGLWKSLPPFTVAAAAGFCVILLLGVLAATRFLARRFGFKRDDEIAAVFCGSKKSLASGLPMAKLLFAGHPGLGLIVLPVMCYNQVQIMFGAWLAEWYARQRAAGAG